MVSTAILIPFPPCSLFQTFRPHILKVLQKPHAVIACSISTEHLVPSCILKYLVNILLFPEYLLLIGININFVFHSLYLAVVFLPYHISMVNQMHITKWC
jgi:hypothetical protein